MIGRCAWRGRLYALRTSICLDVLEVAEQGLATSVIIR